MRGPQRILERGLDDAAMLDLWERGVDGSPAERGLLLFEAAAPETSPDARADASLAERDAAVLALRRATFGRRLASAAACPGCGVALEFELDVVELGLTAPVASAFHVDGQRFRLPTSRDLDAAGRCVDAQEAAQTLARLCCLDDPPPALTPALLADLEAEMARVHDELELRLDCAACGRAWTAGFDICAYFWREIEWRAAALLDDVHFLASRYGWSEAQILAMRPQRRAAYLERCDA